MPIGPIQGTPAVTVNPSSNNLPQIFFGESGSNNSFFSVSDTGSAGSITTQFPTGTSTFDFGYSSPAIGFRGTGLGGGNNSRVFVGSTDGTVLAFL